MGLEVLEPKPTSRPPNFESTMTSSLLFPYSHRLASPTKMGCIASKTTSQDKPFLPIILKYFCWVFICSNKKTHWCSKTILGWSHLLSLNMLYLEGKEVPSHLPRIHLTTNTPLRTCYNHCPGSVPWVVDTWEAPVTSCELSLPWSQDPTSVLGHQSWC